MTPQDQINDAQGLTNDIRVYETKLLRQQVEQLRERYEEKVEVLEREIAALKKDRDSALKWGLLTLGAAVLGMAAWIFKLITRNIA